MIKYLLLGLLAAWLYFTWRRPRSSSGTQAPGKPAPPPSRPQQMVECAHCGVHMPANEALLAPRPASEPDYFCSEDHRRAGPRAH